MATLKLEFDSVATPATTGDVPSVVAPSLNVTVPVGVVAPLFAAVTVALNDTDCPKTELVGVLVKFVVVVAGLTTCERIVDVDAV